MDKKTEELITRIAEEHSRHARPFGCFTKEDIKQEIWIICLERLPYYNEERGPLENFLRVSVKNRLVNKYKEVIKDVKIPCLKCEFYDKNSDGDCAKYGREKQFCSKWNKYLISLESRNALMNTVDSTENCIRDYQGFNDILVFDEVKKTIKENISPEYKYDLEKVLNGETISKPRLRALIKECTKIIKELEEDVESDQEE